MSKPVALYGFKDDDFSGYPCIKIPETNYSIDEYEAIANNLLDMLAGKDDLNFSKAARGIAVLAYNTFMDPKDKGEADPRPFFHKHNEREHWLQYRDEPAIDLGELCEFYLAMNPSLRLVKQDASEFERKSSIGLWAFCHLKAFGRIHHKELRTFFGQFQNQTGSDLMQRWYGFSSTYEIRALDGNVYRALKNEYNNQRNTEILYLFFRAAIILEQNYEKRNFKAQRGFLEEIVFERRNGLRYGGLWLFHTIRKAAGQLGQQMPEVCDRIEKAMRYTTSMGLGNSDRARSVINIFRQFHEQYLMRSIQAVDCERSRYYMYAHVVNNDYFYWIGSREILELSYSMIGLQIFIRLEEMRRNS